MWALLKAIWEGFASFGPIGLVGAMGWAVAIGLAVFLYRKRGEIKELHFEIKKILQTDQETLNNINEKHSKMLQSISDDRVRDIKEVSEDYNNLATHTLQTLDRLVYSIELRRANRRSNND